MLTLGSLRGEDSCAVTEITRILKYYTLSVDIQRSPWISIVSFSRLGYTFPQEHCKSHHEIGFQPFSSDEVSNILLLHPISINGFLQAFNTDWDNSRVFEGLSWGWVACVQIKNSPDVYRILRWNARLSHRSVKDGTITSYVQSVSRLFEASTKDDIIEDAEYKIVLSAQLRNKSPAIHPCPTDSSPPIPTGVWRPWIEGNVCGRLIVADKQKHALILEQ